MQVIHDKMNEAMAWFGSTDPWGLWWLVLNGLAVFIAWLAAIGIAVWWHHNRVRGSRARKAARIINWLLATIAFIAMALVAVWLGASVMWSAAVSLFMDRAFVAAIQPYPPLWLAAVAAASLAVLVWAKLETRNRPPHDGLAGIMPWLREPLVSSPADDTVELPVVAMV